MSAAATLSTPLSAEQIAQYKRDGFLVVPGILNAEEIERYKARAREFALGNVPPGGEKMVVQDVRVARGLVTPDDPERGVWKLLNPGHHDKLFFDYPSHPRLLDVVEQIIGPDIQAFLLMFIYKPPGLQSDHPYHQDAMYFPFGPHEKICGTWIPLDRAAADNGTLCVLPGSHTLEVLPHGLPEGDLVNYGIFGAEGYMEPRADELVLELNPGDGVFFHSHLLHRTGPNTSDRHRRVLTVHYASSECKLWGDRHKALDFRLVRGRKFDGCI